MCAKPRPCAAYGKESAAITHPNSPVNIKQQIRAHASEFCSDTSSLIIVIGDPF